MSLFDPTRQLRDSLPHTANAALLRAERTVGVRHFAARRVDKTLRLDFFGMIGDWWEGATASGVRNRLESETSVSRLVVRLNTLGGYLHEGLAIYHLLKAYPAPVTVQVYGLAASAGSLIAMAGDTIEMGTGTEMMVHNAATCACGEASHMRDIADSLDSATLGAAEIYAQRTGVALEEIRAMMDRTTYLSARDAVAKGFATHLVERFEADPGEGADEDEGEEETGGQTALLRAALLMQRARRM